MSGSVRSLDHRSGLRGLLRRYGTNVVSCCFHLRTLLSVASRWRRSQMPHPDDRRSQPQAGAEPGSEFPILPLRGGRAPRALTTAGKSRRGVGQVVTMRVWAHSPDSLPQNGPTAWPPICKPLKRAAPRVHEFLLPLLPLAHAKQ